MTHWELEGTASLPAVVAGVKVEVDGCEVQIAMALFVWTCERGDYVSVVGPDSRHAQSLSVRCVLVAHAASPPSRKAPGVLA